MNERNGITGGEQKIQEYLKRISEGEDEEKILQGLPTSFRSAIKAQLNQSAEGEKKVNEYLERIKAGEDKQKILDGLPRSFVAAIEAGLDQSNEEILKLVNEDVPFIPIQMQGWPAEVLAEMWIVPYYLDPEKTKIEQEKKRKAVAYLQKKEREEEELKILNEGDQQKIEEAKRKLEASYGETGTNVSEVETKERQTIEVEILQAKEFYEHSLDGALEQLRKEKGIVELREGIPTIIVSDLHARRDFLKSVLTMKDASGNVAIDLLKEGKINIVCVGDGMHSEMASNWTTTRVPYDLEKLIAKGGKIQAKLQVFKQMIESASGKKYLDMEPVEIYKAIRTKSVAEFFSSIESGIKESLLEEEMARSFGLMKMVMDLKASHPENFHYVRGNHDDIKETLKGFEKYDSESERVKRWTKDNFGESFLDKYAEFEANLPLVARGKDFVVSHTAPSKVLDAESIINRDRETAISLTWTNNLTGGTSEDYIIQTLQNLGMENARWFIGHRSVDGGKVREQFDGRLIQINHDTKQLVAFIEDGKNYSSDQILDLKE